MAPTWTLPGSPKAGSVVSEFGQHYVYDGHEWVDLRSPWTVTVSRTGWTLVHHADGVLAAEFQGEPMDTEEYQEAWSREMGSVPTTHVAGTGSVRQRCLETALKYTQQDRNKAHGDPENNFSNIARFWNAHVRARYGPDIPELDATDVAIMMAGMKMARLSFNPTHEDSWIDLAGYAACGMEIALGD